MEARIIMVALAVVLLSLKTARGAKFCRAHLVGWVGKSKNKALYVVEIHPKDVTKVYTWTVPETKLYGGHLLEKGKFYRYAFKEELYD